MRPITAADVMNPEVLTVPADMPVASLASFLVEREISGAPVADAAGHLVGVVSVTDIALAASGGADRARDGGRPDFFARGFENGPTRDELDRFDLNGSLNNGNLIVRDIMTPDVFTVPEDTPVPELAELMLDNHVHRLLVTRGEKVVGIVSTSDLLGLLVEEQE